MKGLCKKEDNVGLRGKNRIEKSLVDKNIVKKYRILKVMREGDDWKKLINVYIFEKGISIKCDIILNNFEQKYN